MAPGILYVTMQPKPELPTDQFEDWYMNEHGPLRLRLSFCQNGFRYRATDLDGPGKGMHEWMAIYDMDDLEKLNGEEYLKLRGAPLQTQRERDLRPLLDIDRRSYDLINERKADNFQPVDRRGGEEAGNVMVHVAFTIKPDQDPEEIGRWYDEEHTAMLQKVPGWRRTRRFKTSTTDQRPVTEYLALHEYAPKNGLGGPEFQAAVSTDWAKRISDTVIASKHRRVYQHYYTFGPAPRYLSNITSWISPAGITRTMPASDSSPSAVESYITTPDGAVLPYRLEGSPSGPVILCINSILTHHSIWDGFVTQFLAAHPEYRILRYLSRGRTSTLGSTDPITLSTLTTDVLHLLDSLRIPSPALTIGVSLGGITALNLGLTSPERIPAFIACDTNSFAPPSNPGAWTERIAMAESDPTSTPEPVADSPYGGPSPDPFVATVDTTYPATEKIVGEALAKATAERWFADKEHARFSEVRDMVRTNSLDGFRRGVNALFEYDVRPSMEGCRSRGHFLVGAQDGVLPKSMKGMAEELGDGKGGKGVGLTIVEGAGHLPMVEKPEDVVKAVESMLGL